eukprot:CAMPEP_0185581748 /NCGR_PEP_ID=MMETSP0434-20130131/18887_1 /TAXON_ID=626734 ORGANISM="Favella taraikaensis, Strain Fe Narragansett Bay" /NCGR_SAMPLE_ID=MMETSP0434 /ASSEMBLY_ACC=CAM_ASM_000379 /LENGTH=100 /DNA_ID=CAMNT_0028200365 /DNA_START=744 /DNA_END=1046 /DNA_ORIENTATION=+
MDGIQRQLKLTSFFKKYFYGRRSKTRYLSYAKLREKKLLKAGSGSDVTKLCERFTELSMTKSKRENGTQAPNESSIEVSKYIKTYLLPSSSSSSSAGPQK